MSRAKKAMELVGYCQRRGVMESLLAALEKEREKVYRETFGAQLHKPDVPPMARLEAVPTPTRNPQQIFVSHPQWMRNWRTRLVGMCGSGV
jgi:hypothetical protein